jgi:CRP/FNR family transcriptional regulator, cyclic AMP receptor protein
MLQVIERSDAERRILRRGWLAAQPDPIRSAVLERCRLLHVDDREFLFHAGDGPGGIYGVVSGGIGIHVPAANDETTLVHIGRAGLWFGYGPLLRGGERSLTFSVMEPSCLFHVTLPALQEISSLSPSHQRAILSVTEYGMDVAISIVGSLTIRNPACRVAATLLRIMPADDEGGAPGELVLRQAELGEMTSLDRRVVNRILRRMEMRGWIALSYGRIAVVDPPALAEFARS